MLCLSVAFISEQENSKYYHTGGQHAAFNQELLSVLTEKCACINSMKRAYVASIESHIALIWLWNNTFMLFVFSSES